MAGHSPDVRNWQVHRNPYLKACSIELSACPRGFITTRRSDMLSYPWKKMIHPYFLTVLYFCGIAPNKAPSSPGNTLTYMESLIFQMKIFVILSPFPFPKSWTCRWGKNGKLYSKERACEVDKNALITWRIFPVCATTPNSSDFLSVTFFFLPNFFIGIGALCFNQYVHTRFTVDLQIFMSTDIFLLLSFLVLARMI